MNEVHARWTGGEQKWAHGTVNFFSSESTKAAPEWRRLLPDRLITAVAAEGTLLLDASGFAPGHFWNLTRHLRVFELRTAAAGSCSSTQSLQLPATSSNIESGDDLTKSGAAPDIARLLARHHA